ncbi:Alpha-1,3-mannosyltransferase-like protein [Puccinia graminis f. sp. tritici]|uniref:Asparagine-linked glycosylation protein 2 n=2 Tax=Puccinia graminis f. sp. tritici TaxID=56615 RepID=A0A5B0PMB0_PUCGR|nr:Alpha-1,3-mannosyltransferase-like protein [Puccinia graminis f. sp. tritici]
MDNRRTLKALQESVPKDLVQLTLSTEDVGGAERMPDVLFLLNVSQEHKLALLHGRSTKLLGYTASNEHLGIGPLEAMACRLPVLAVDSGGPKETVSDTRTGFLVPPDPEKWAQSIRNILAMDDQQRRQMGDAGRDRVLELFSTEVMAKHFERAIQDILSPVRQTDLWLEQGFFHLLAFIFLPFLTIWVGTWKFM